VFQKLPNIFFCSLKCTSLAQGGRANTYLQFTNPTYGRSKVTMWLL
jgi:hypothetical protein